MTSLGPVVDNPPNSSDAVTTLSSSVGSLLSIRGDLAGLDGEYLANTWRILGDYLANTWLGQLLAVLLIMSEDRQT